MPVIKNSVLIQCTPEEAFDYLSDLRSELEWNPDCKFMEKITDGPVGLGTKFRAKWIGSPYVEVDTVACDRPHSWSMHTDGPLEINFTARLEPVDQGTKLSVDFEPIAHGWFKLVFPFFVWFARRHERANMIRIRETLERRVGARPPREAATR